MYFGSVRFFKHLILAAIILTVGTLAVCAAWLNIQNQRLHMSIFALEQQQKAQAQAAVNRELLQLTAQDKPPHAADAPAPPDAPALNAPDAEAATLDYQALYPELYADGASVSSDAKDGQKCMYLSFDDGPSSLTEKILDKLDAHQVKATFFVVGRNFKGKEALLQRIVDEGHALGIHTHSHQYKAIYASVESFLDDFYQVYDAVYQHTGYKAQIFRFPGGSVNGYNMGNYQQIIAEMLRRGFVYFDWNISAEDTVGTASAKSVKNNLLHDYERFDIAIALMHETGYVLDALDDVITAYQAAGFCFAPLAPDVRPIIFSYPD